MTRHSQTRRSLLGRLGTAGATAIAISVAGCTGDGGDDDGSDDGDADGGDGGDGATVGMGAVEFQPDSLTVETGTTVTWENDSDAGHTVTAYEDEIPDGAEYFASGDFDSEQAARDDISGGMLQSGDTYEHTFETAGTYEYFCVPHEGQGMTGTVTVE